MSTTTPRKSRHANRSRNETETLPLVRTSNEHSTIHTSLAQVRYYIVFLANVAAWYNTNGMNGISMQRFAKIFQPQNDDELDDNSMMMNSLLTITAITSVVTVSQLFLGAMVGYSLLLLHGLLVSSEQKSHHTPSSLFTLSYFHPQESISSALHGIGSMCTNLGFMYGSASLVQIIKLVEPFEILLLSRLFLPDESKLLTIGVASSMTLTIGAAVSLIQSRNTKPHFNAVAFAILSGLTLSTRNVLQRKQHSRSTKATTGSSSSSAPTRSVMETSLIQFTQLSWQSAFIMTVFSMVLFLVLGLFQTPAIAPAVFHATIQGMNWGVLTWHPLYNAFSMITLGYCSALTHSLLNAGKRVFAIVMAIVWFKETFSKGTAVGLTLVFCGGCWYTVESKAMGEGHRYWMRLTKPMIALLLLQVIQLVHEQDQIKAIPS